MTLTSMGVGSPCGHPKYLVRLGTKKSSSWSLAALCPQWGQCWLAVSHELEKACGLYAPWSGKGFKMSKNPFALLSDEGDTSDDERRPPVSAPAPAVASSEPKQPRKQSRDQSRPTTSVISQVNRRDNARGDGEVDGNDSRGACCLLLCRQIRL